MGVEQARPIFGVRPPDLVAQAKRMAQDYETSAFTDVETLERWIVSALLDTWNKAAMFTEQEITRRLKNSGHMDQFGKLKPIAKEG